MLEEEVCKQVSNWVGLFVAPNRKVLREVNRELQRQWKSNGGLDATDAQRQLSAVEENIANVRGAIEEGISDVKWASARLEELHA